jgi:hypothetical protein
MPLKSGSSQKTKSSNIGELVRAFKRTGKIGNTKPRSAKHARVIAAAIAYDKARKAK